MGWGRVGGGIQGGDLAAHLADIIQYPAQQRVGARMLQAGGGQGFVQFRQRLFLEGNPRFQFIQARAE